MLNIQQPNSAISSKRSIAIGLLLFSMASISTVLSTILAFCIAKLYATNRMKHSIGISISVGIIVTTAVVIAIFSLMSVCHSVKYIEAGLFPKYQPVRSVAGDTELRAVQSNIEDSGVESVCNIRGDRNLLDNNDIVPEQGPEQGIQNMGFSE